jgi:hypothetical protein
MSDMRHLGHHQVLSFVPQLIQLYLNWSSVHRLCECLGSAQCKPIFYLGDHAETFLNHIAGGPFDNKAPFIVYNVQDDDLFFPLPVAATDSHNHLRSHSLLFMTCA